MCVYAVVNKGVGSLCSWGCMVLIASNLLFSLFETYGFRFYVKLLRSSLSLYYYNTQPHTHTHMHKQGIYINNMKYFSGRGLCKWF